MKVDFTGKQALITGATRGIGKAIADCFLDAGAQLILTGTKQSEIELLNSEARDRGHYQVEYIRADFSDSDSTNQFLDRLRDIERIDVCVNNAGINIIAEFTDTTFDDFGKINEINTNVPYRILQIVGPKMIAEKYGRIVNIASIWSVITRRGRSMYSTSKNALVGLTKSLAVEWAVDNVLVNAVSPGFTLTELTKNTNTREELAQIETSIPMRRMAEPFEIARVVAFLCSDQNTYITGQNITIDGGFTNV